MLASIFGNRVIEVPSAATTDGAQLGLWDYNGCNCQHWAVDAIGTVTATKLAQDAQIQLFPNPARGGNFSLQLPAGTAATLTVADISGRVVFRRELAAGGPREIQAGLGAGAYVVQIATVGAVVTRKLLVL